MSPQTWRDDVRRTSAALPSGKILIVSVVATPADGATVRQVADDFAQCAAWAAEAGAHVVEANLSCRNVCTNEGSIYLDAQMSRTVATAIRQAIGKTPLLLKAGHFADPGKLRAFLKFVNGIADGVAMVNALSRPVLHANGRPVFGDLFVKAGVLGRGIHQSCVENLKRAGDIIAGENLKLTRRGRRGRRVIGRRRSRFFEAGAAAVLMGSSPMYMPDIAAGMKLRHPDW